MANFAYVALDKSGRRVEGVVEAADRRGAMLAVEKLGRVPVSVTEAKATAAEQKGAWWRLSTRRDRMKPHEVMLFTAELSDLLAAGMTLGNALNCLAGRGEGAEAHIAADLRDRIIQGEALSAAVRAHFLRLLHGCGTRQRHQIRGHHVAHFEALNEFQQHERIIARLSQCGPLIRHNRGLTAGSAHSEWRALCTATQASYLDRRQVANVMWRSFATFTMEEGSGLPFTTTTPTAPTIWAVRKTWSLASDVNSSMSSSSTSNTSLIRSDAMTCPTRRSMPSPLTRTSACNTSATSLIVIKKPHFNTAVSGHIACAFLS